MVGVSLAGLTTNSARLRVLIDGKPSRATTTNTTTMTVYCVVLYLGPKLGPKKGPKKSRVPATLYYSYTYK